MTQTTLREDSKQEQLKIIEQEIKENLNCPLKKTATNLVFGKGNPDAKILFIGEAPGEKEDQQGIPFVGSAGKKLDELLKKIDLTMEDVYIANILKYRPPKNRNPTTEEIKNHTPYLIKQIKIINPQIICTLGNYATKFVLAGFTTNGMNKIQGITKLHGETQKINELIIMPMYHPAATLYNPDLKETLEKDFEKLKQKINNQN
ncbi:uracil-DNA glycosylase [Candidatus Woesearchaeota archaeon]|nr:uracil-DNA glycosylase [Candidatus Woesearchaeota archaeon]